MPLSDISQVCRGNISPYLTALLASGYADTSLSPPLPSPSPPLRPHTCYIFGQLAQCAG